MYFVEKKDDCEGKLIRHNYTNDAGDEETESVALCYSEETASLITDFLNISENLAEREEFTKVIKDFIRSFFNYLYKNNDKKRTYGEIHNVIEILSFLNR